MPVTQTATRPSESVDIRERYQRIRRFSERLCETLTPEDCMLQSMPDCSPTRWHLAHTTWFFETFLLGDDPHFEPFNPAFGYLFNSYYNSVGEQFPRSHRGLLSRPTVAEILDYRRWVDERVTQRIDDGVLQRQPRLASVLEIGLNHEQQHQELILTDIKHALSLNPLKPTYRAASGELEGPLEEDDWAEREGGVFEIGRQGEGFAYDNESPRHRVLVEDYRLRTRPVNSGEFLEFMEDGGYHQSQLWLSEGWRKVQEQGWQAPLYWYEHDGDWHEFTLSGPRSLNRRAPVCHVSYFEADAFARWAGCRLPTEAEWELASTEAPRDGAFVDVLLERELSIHPTPVPIASGSPSRLMGDVWEWTASPYVGYPGYQAEEGALGEYNGKFMCNQFVLRGGSCATSSDHIRATYRNFFAPDARWQFSGIRLAK